MCTGNECRSPAAAQLLRAGLGGVNELSICSGGVAVARHAPLCRKMGKLLDARRLPTRSADEHRSRPITAATLEAADLVLTAERSHCAEVAQLAPVVIPRTFTIRDAAGLASFVVSHVAEVSSNGARLVPGAPPLPPATSSELRIHWLISEMNEARGLAAPVPSAGRSLLHPRRQLSDADPDVPDPHAATRVSHTTAFRLLDGAVDSLAASVKRLLEL